MQYYKIMILFVIIIKLSLCNKYLLPKILVPEAYNLKIITTLDEGGPNDFTFEGLVEIDVVCIVKRTIKFTLHVENLEINQHYKEVIHIASGRQLGVQSMTLDPEYDFLHFVVEPLQRNERYRIGILFKGRLATELSGYYLSSYKHNGVQTWLALTKFEPTYARRAFPCFDEPEYKATFNISLGHHKKFVAISNMPKIMTQTMNDIDKDYILDTYHETLPMSTYLVAFIIFDFHFKTSSPKLSNTKFRIWARPGIMNQVTFAKQTAPQALTFLENYFDISSPLPKQDLVAVPDFASGAMENWGLITFREGFLLFDAKISSSKNRYKVASVICHELAHSWFGNLVTMKWWNDLWLNEGFATYMTIVCVDYLFPKKNYRRTESLSVINIIFRQDSLFTSIPLSAEVDNPKKIDELFGGIAYKKGATLIRMMEKSLGEDVLRAGVIQYLKKHAYSNAAQDDLWEALTEASHRVNAIPNDWTIKQIMDTWSLQVGYPLVTVERNYETGVATLTQRRYVRVEVKKKSKNGPCWWIPLTYTTSKVLDFNTTKPKLWLTCPHKEEIIKFNKPDQWMIFNNDLTGLYKVNYDERNWKLIIDHLKNKDIDDIHEISRLHLIENMMEFAGLGITNYKLAFDMMDYIRRETKYDPWNIALTSLSRIALLLKTSASAHIMEGYIKGLVEDIYKKYGGLNATTTQAFAKLAFRKACEFNVQQCKDDVKTLFGLFMKQNNATENPIHADIRGIIYCNALKLSGEKEWHFLWDIYKESNVVSEQVMILQALGCSGKKTILEKFIKMTLNESSGIRKQNCYIVFRAVAKNEIMGFAIAKSFLYKNGAAIFKSLMPKGNKITNYLLVIAEQITQRVDFKEFKEFLEKHPKFQEYANVGIKQALEIIQMNIQWYDKNFRDVISVLLSKSPSLFRSPNTKRRNLLL